MGARSAALLPDLLWSLASLGVTLSQAAVQGQQNYVLNLVGLRSSPISQDTDRPSCYLPAGSGRATGYCAEVQEVQEQIEFCRDVVQYRACIPARMPLWSSWNATKKDLLLKGLFKDMVEARIAREMNITPDEYVPVHFLANPDCVAALKNVLCWFNFPKCNDANASLHVCRSSCEQYYTKCKYDSDGKNGLHAACQSETVNNRGIFDSGTSGREMRLADGNQVCPSTATEDMSNSSLVPPAHTSRKDTTGCTGSHLCGAFWYWHLRKSSSWRWFRTLESERLLVSRA